MAPVLGNSHRYLSIFLISMAFSFLFRLTFYDIVNVSCEIILSLWEKCVKILDTGGKIKLNIKYDLGFPSGRAAVYLDLVISYCLDFGFDDMTIRVKGIKINPDGEIVF